tara:strand:+ start:1592 stop:3550 length:1959 start_codon:yes stop_codon:yes gene_type:complete
MDKKFLVAVFLGVVFLVAVFPVVTAYTNITIKDAAANATNHSSSGNTFFVTCGTVFQDIVNMTVYYNTSTTTGGDSGTGAAAPLGGFVAGTTATNTSVNQSVFNLTVDISGYTATKTYGFWCYPHENEIWTNTTFTNSTATANVTIDSTAPAMKIFNKTKDAVHNYDNTTNKSSNTQFLELNVSVTDTIWLPDSAFCFFNTNTTNQSVSLTKVNSTFGYCNSTNLNLTNLADGNHQIKIYMNDSLGNALVNDTKWFQLDSTAPVVVIHTSYSNNTAKKNTDYLMLNVSVIDALNGLPDSAFCFFGINTTNQTISLEKHSSTAGWCNSSRLNLTTMPDGINYTNVYINDSLNNKRLNKTISVLVDTTNPTLTPSCSPNNVVEGSTITCTCSGSDATSGISTQTDAESITKDVEGAYTYSCTITDVAGNSATTTAAYTYTSLGTTTSSSSSGGGTASSVKSNTFAKVTPGKVSIMKNFAKETGVKEIQIEVNNEVKNIKVTVSKYDNKPAEVSVEKTGKVYQYMQINTENLADNLKKATVTIKVEKSWLSDNALERENIILSKFNEGTEEWNELTTTYKEEDETYDYFDVELTSFSYFAISEKVVEEEVEEDKGIGTILGEKISEKSKNLAWLWIIIAVLVVIAIYVIFNRKKE